MRKAEEPRSKSKEPPKGTFGKRLLDRGFSRSSGGRLIAIKLAHAVICLTYPINACPTDVERGARKSVVGYSGALSARRSRSLTTSSGSQRPSKSSASGARLDVNPRAVRNDSRCVSNSRRKFDYHVAMRTPENSIP